jgi:hypothetical protein
MRPCKSLKETKPVAAGNSRQVFLALLFVLFALPGKARAAEESHKDAVKLVTQIQRADYEGDRVALERLYT